MIAASALATSAVGPAAASGTGLSAAGAPPRSRTGTWPADWAVSRCAVTARPGDIPRSRRANDRGQHDDGEMTSMPTAAASRCRPLPVLGQVTVADHGAAERDRGAG